MSETVTQVKQLADEALNDEGKLSELVELLSTGSRRERQAAASSIHDIAKVRPTALGGHIAACIDALGRPEAQTRWEVLETLALLVEVDARTCGKAIPEAEIALFDEDSGPVRLAAVRYLCKIGATTPTRSEKVWPLLDEAIQCYHGDLEYNDMLTALTDFSKGKLSDAVKAGFAERMAFDASNGKGGLQRRSKIIVDNLS